MTKLGLDNSTHGPCEVRALGNALIDMAGNSIDQRREIERLRRLVEWCRPRLNRDEYKAALDRYLATAAEPDHTPIAPR